MVSTASEVATVCNNVLRIGDSLGILEINAAYQTCGAGTAHITGPESTQSDFAFADVD